MHSGLTPKQYTVLQALATGSDVTTAAAAAGIHRTTVHTWCRTLPVFRAALREAKAAHAESIQEQIRSIGDSAVAALRGILENENSSEANRLRASLAVIRAIEAANPDRQTPSARDFENFMEAAMHAGGENAVFYHAVLDRTALHNSSEFITSAGSTGSGPTCNKAPASQTNSAGSM